MKHLINEEVARHCDAILYKSSFHGSSPTILALLESEAHDGDLNSRLSWHIIEGIEQVKQRTTITEIILSDRGWPTKVSLWALLVYRSHRVQSY